VGRPGQTPEEGAAWIKEGKQAVKMTQRLFGAMAGRIAALPEAAG
jgi:hypothetical protein